MAIVIGPRFTIKGIDPPDVRTAPPAARRAFWNAASAFIAQAKEIELRNGLDKDGDPMAALAKYTREHRHSDMGPADPFAPALQPAHGLSRTRSLFRAQPTARLDGVICWWAYDAITAESWGKMLAIHRAGSDRLPPRDVIGLSKASTAEVKKKAAAWWQEYTKSKGATPVPEFAPELEPEPPPKFRYERVPAYKPKYPERAIPKEPHRISQIKINGRVYTLQSGSAAQVKRAIAAKGFGGFGKVIRAPDGKLIRFTSDELQTGTRGKLLSDSEALATRGYGPAGLAGNPAELQAALKTTAPGVRVAQLRDLTGATAKAQVTAAKMTSGKVYVRAVAPDYETRVQVESAKTLRITAIDVPLARQGKGIGREIITGIIKAAGNADLERITMTAARAADQVGYKVWPKFGFDAALPAAIVKKLPEALRGAKTVADLYKTAAGRAWWEKHGVTINLSLEL